MEIKNIQSDQDFQKVMDSVNKYIDTINKYQEDNPHLVQPTAMELAQFHKSHFYHNWLHRYRRLFAFGPLGNHGVIAIPNTTFEEWLYWFSEWAEAFMDDYNAFKKLVFEALLLIEKHLEAIDAELQNHEGRITANEAHLADHDAQLVDHQNHLERLDKGLADETKARQDADNAEKNARIAKDNDLQNQINAEKGAREAKDNEQDGRLNNIEAKDREQDGRLNNIEAKDREQDGRLNNIEAKDREQDDRLNNIEAKDREQDARIGTLEQVTLSYGYDHYVDLTPANRGVGKDPDHPDWYTLRMAYSEIDSNNNGDNDILRYQPQVNWVHFQWQNYDSSLAPYAQTDNGVVNGQVLGYTSDATLMNYIKPGFLAVYNSGFGEAGKQPVICVFRNATGPIYFVVSSWLLDMKPDKGTWASITQGTVADGIQRK